LSSKFQHNNTSMSGPN